MIFSKVRRLRWQELWPVAKATSSEAEGGISYRRDIDGLRAIAVLAVVMHHAVPARLPGGFSGVDVFFVISGYLISLILFRGLEADTFRFGVFYARRVRRLFRVLVEFSG